MIRKESKINLSNIDFLNSIQGTYKTDSDVEFNMENHLIIVDGTTLYHSFFPNTNRSTIYDYEIHTIDIKNNAFYAAGRYYKIRGNKIYEHYLTSDEKVNPKINEIYIKQSSSTNVPKQGYSPRIGMTASEVENSNWGRPNKINKTTTAYGTDEQWVYGNGQYIYLENGIVTAIQE